MLKSKLLMLIAEGRLTIMMISMMMTTMLTMIMMISGVEAFV